MWIARDKDGALFVSCDEPKKGEHCEYYGGYDLYDRDDFFYLDSELMPEVTWENSPMEAIPALKGGI